METYKLSDLLELKYGKDHKKLRNGSYPCYGSGGIIRYVDEYLYDKESILIPRKGSLNNLFYVNKPFWTVDTIFWSKINSKRVDGKYLYYLLHNYDLAVLNEGTAIPSLTTKVLNQLNIKITSLSKQRKIAQILSMFDEKIELNNEINNNLEKQAWLLFNKYFINNKNIHKGWSTISLTSIANFLNGIPINKFQPSVNEDYLPVLKIKELRQGFTDSQSDICSTNIDKQYIIRNGDLIFSWSGTLLVDFWCGDKCILNQHLFKVTSEKLDLWFVFLWLKYHLESFINIAKNKATTMGHIKRKDLEKTFILLPNEDDYEKLSNLFSPIFKKIILSKLENKKLKHIKKQLLPRLLSGQIDVSQIKL